jgi:hypothetical protein
MAPAAEGVEFDGHTMPRIRFQVKKRYSESYGDPCRQYDQGDGRDGDAHPGVGAEGNFDAAGRGLLDDNEVGATAMAPRSAIPVRSSIRPGIRPSATPK